MRQQLLGAVIGGVLLYAWGALAWTVLPLHTATLLSARDDDAVLAMLREQMPAKGAYFLPAAPGVSDSPGADRARSREEHMRKVENGPTAIVFFSPAGIGANHILQMVWGLLIAIAAAGIVTWFLLRSSARASSYLSRVAYCGMFGVFLCAAVHLNQVNWLGAPWDYVAADMLDGLIAWIVAGVGIGWVVKRTEPAPGPPLAV